MVEMLAYVSLASQAAPSVLALVLRTRRGEGFGAEMRS